MAKFYVTSGDMEIIVTADDHSEAYVKAITEHYNSAEGQVLGIVMKASERGFALAEDDDSATFRDTLSVIKEAGLPIEYEEEE